LPCGQPGFPPGGGGYNYNYYGGNYGGNNLNYMGSINYAGSVYTNPQGNFQGPPPGVDVIGVPLPGPVVNRLTGDNQESEKHILYRSGEDGEEVTFTDEISDSKEEGDSGSSGFGVSRDEVQAGAESTIDSEAADEVSTRQVGGQCQCDNQCQTYGDCCSDYFIECRNSNNGGGGGPVGPIQSCLNQCGSTQPKFPVPQGSGPACYCESSCLN
jgi:hypothetical protein